MQPDDLSDSELPDGYWLDWPCCPACEHRRRTECPVCGVSGSDFPLADRWPPDSPEPDEPVRSSRQPAIQRQVAAGSPPLLMCPCCDEPFRPRFFRYCEWCGRDFGSGREPAVDPEPLGQRAVWTAVGLILLGLAALAWFRLLLGP